MYFKIVGSGSKGNATLVVENNTLILIDFGLSFKRVNKAIKELGFTFNDIDAAIFTHDHTDHICSLKFLSPKKCYALDGTLPSLANVVKINEPFIIKDLTITPFETSHDATNPCGYVIEGKKDKFVYMTDTGVFSLNNLKLVSNPDYLMIESNHDIKMLLDTNRPLKLKKRIMSNKGHLNNEDSALAAIDIIGDKTKEIVLAHISLEANKPELALETYKKIFDENGVSLKGIQLKCANQFECVMGGHYED